MDTLELKLSKVGETDNPQMYTEIFINGEKIKNKFIEPYAFFAEIANKGDMLPDWALEEESRREGYSAFEPFTCNCGVAGCAGIWNGICTKHRKHTVEWRTSKKDGYTFLKSFYRFDRKQYYTEICNAWQVFRQLMAEGVNAEGQYNAFSEEMEAIPLKNHYSNYWTWDEVSTAMDAICKKRDFR